MHPMLNIAIRAARRAGDLIARHAARAADLRADAKGLNDFVTEVDRLAEEAIIDILRTAYPAHGILAEESGRSGPDGDYLWIVDPLDGTTNFMHGFPQFAVSVALQVKGRIEQGVVYDPLRQELFTATRGSGARLNDHRIRVSKQRTLQGALLGTGFPFREQGHIDTYLQTLREFMSVTSGIRRAGAAALDLAYVACGRLDGFWEFGLKPWDIAAGAVLIEEAGGMIADLQGDNSYLERGDILAANPRIYDDMLSLLKGMQTQPP